MIHHPSSWSSTGPLGGGFGTDSVSGSPLVYSATPLEHDSRPGGLRSGRLRDPAREPRSKRLPPDRGILDAELLQIRIESSRIVVVGLHQGRDRRVCHFLCRLGRILGRLSPADSGMRTRQERQIVRPTSELCVFLPELGPPRKRLISVRSDVRVVPGPLFVIPCPAWPFGLAGPRFLRACLLTARNCARNAVRNRF